MRADADLRRPLPIARGAAPLVWRILQVQLVVCGLLAVGLLALVPPGSPLQLADRVGVLAACALAAALAAAVLAPTILRPVARLADLAERCARDRQAGGSNLATGLAAQPDEIGRLATAIRRMAAVLYNRIDSNEHFAADVAHEIRTPLASLHGAVCSLRLVRGDAQRARLLAIIEDDVRRLDRLVRDIAQASQLGGALATETMREFDLVTMLAPLLDRFRDAAEAQGVLFVTDLPARPLPMRGIEERVAQVASNLVANALSFSEPGDGLRVWLRRRGDSLVLAVEDSGPGIPDAALERIFTRFYSHRPGGTGARNAGLGLSICRQIVEVHGGTIRAENILPSEHDAGSQPCGARVMVEWPA